MFECTKIHIARVGLARFVIRLWAPLSVAPTPGSVISFPASHIGFAEQGQCLTSCFGQDQWPLAWRWRRLHISMPNPSHKSV
jgi:hypothetical protein